MCLRIRQPFDSVGRNKIDNQGEYGLWHERNRNNADAPNLDEATNRLWRSRDEDLAAPLEPDLIIGDEHGSP